ncbi:hypothetical protein CVT25_009438 [Psilocybe cyanescens]|uniref:Uncharacterized protein n=1 Tax=Psilocybe cyanescens TaxID=93625 RepID=A0A409XVE8_PSICY|nr:hypothetical protein CVT25_009438 [Psilocybe cyanescens]
MTAKQTSHRRALKDEGSVDRKRITVSSHPCYLVRSLDQQIGIGIFYYNPHSTDHTLPVRHLSCWFASLWFQFSDIAGESRSHHTNAARINYVSRHPVNVVKYGIRMLSPIFKSAPDLVTSGTNIGSKSGIISSTCQTDLQDTTIS